MLWQPDKDRIQNSAMMVFIDHIDSNYALPDRSYEALYQFSIEQSDCFWQELITFFDIAARGELSPVNTDPGFRDYGWFPKLQLNFAENLLKNGEADSPAIVGLLENGNRREFTYRQLRKAVAEFQAGLKNHVKAGEVLACYMPNIPETVIAMLATTALGGVFTSTSCDFGVDGVVDRFGQSKPKVLVTCAGYSYNGKYFDLTEKIKAVAAQIDSIEKIVVVDFLNQSSDIRAIPKAVAWEDFIDPMEKRVNYVYRAFADPLYIMYSSGTTGKPKCIVHGIGGVLLQHVKELGLHTDFNEQKNIFFFTTCGWMMWNWLVSSLFFGGTVTLYDGSPAYPSLEDFLGIIGKEKINIFGTSPKFLKAVEDADIDSNNLDLDSLETILSTGSPLLPEQFDFVYEKIKHDVLLSSISGGTDILGCFFLGNPILPVYRGELQCRGLGMAVSCFDEDGNEIKPVSGKEVQGELVCLKSFPSRPIYFLGDQDGSKIHDAYFSKYKDVWYHGDFIAITEHGGAKFFGRSDATLNPGGVRIGTSEIYRQTETLDYIEDAVCVGKQADGDVDVVLFVKMKGDEILTEERKAEIKQRIKNNTTPRHVPRAVVAVRDIPYTRSGKKIELAVARIINGQPVTNKEAIANPDCLSEYEQYR